MTQQLAFVPDERMADVPALPTDRPMTRAEVWEYVQHIYEGVKTHDEQVTLAKDRWLGNYLWWVNVHGWRKQPDWTEGESVIGFACPTGPIDAVDKPNDVIYALLDRAQKARAA